MCGMAKVGFNWQVHDNSFLRTPSYPGHVRCVSVGEKAIRQMALVNGGEGGIRTHDRVSPIHAFQACALSHSATSPQTLQPME